MGKSKLKLAMEQRGAFVYPSFFLRIDTTFNCIGVLLFQDYLFKKGTNKSLRRKRMGVTGMINERFKNLQRLIVDKDDKPRPKGYKRRRPKPAHVIEDKSDQLVWLRGMDGTEDESHVHSIMQQSFPFRVDEMSRSGLNSIDSMAQNSFILKTAERVSETAQFVCWVYAPTPRPSKLYH